MYIKTITIEPEDAKFISQTCNFFTDEEHDWLNNPRRFKTETDYQIKKLYTKYTDKLKFSMFALPLHTLEERDDKFRSKSIVQRAFIKCYLLNWMIDYPQYVDEDFLFSRIDSRPAAGQLIKALYSKCEVEKVDFKNAVRNACGKYLCETDEEADFYECYLALKDCKNPKTTLACYVEVGNETIDLWQAVENIRVCDLLSLIDSELEEKGYASEIPL